MKVVHIVNADTRGGAPKAAFALNKALQGIGVDSTMLVQRKFSNDESIDSFNNSFIDKHKTNLRMLVDLLQMKVHTKTEKGRFSFGSIGLDISNHKLVQEADIIHLHWINEGYLSLKSLSKLAKLKKPIVWTLHDMWAFTGGCHYSAGCRRFEEICCNCPYLKTPLKNDYSKTNQNKKKDTIKNLDITFLTCSIWLSGVAKRSFLLHNKAIYPQHNTLELEIYKPLDRLFVREKLKLPSDKILALFVAISLKEERKGFTYLKKSISHLIEKHPELKQKMELMIMGKFEKEQMSDIPLKIHTLGRISSEMHISEIYNSADIFLAPSLEDNLPNTIMEALSCGIPIVAFNIGGIPEMVVHRNNGYLAKERSIEDFSNGIIYLIDDQNQLKKMKLNAREKIVGEFHPEKISMEHLEIYKRIIEKHF